jgi:hypothetical protein
MKQVASLQYGVIFKKDFSKVEGFKAFVKDIIGIELDSIKLKLKNTNNLKQTSKMCLKLSFKRIR